MVKSYAPLLVEAAHPLVDPGRHFGVLKKGGIVTSTRWKARCRKRSFFWTFFNDRIVPLVLTLLFDYVWVAFLMRR